MTNPIIETDLAEVLKQMNQKLDNLSSDVNELKIGQARVEEKLDSQGENIKELKDTQKKLSADVADLKGAKSLIIPILVAVTTSILTLVIRSIPIS